MEISLKDAASLIGGKIFGNENLIIKNISKIEEAKEGDLTFLYLPAYEKYFPSTKASAILVKKGFNKTRNDITYVEVDNPNKAFFRIIHHFYKPDYKLTGIDSTAFVASDAVLGDNVSLGKNVVISSGCKIGNNTKIYHNTVLLEDVEIGSDTIIFQNVSIREKCVIGNNVIIHPGTVIGSDGFGYSRNDDGSYLKIPQIGNVIIEDNVEIGSNVSIDRASLGSTVIKKGVKLDNLVQIAHNVTLGENTVISAQTGISGSTKVGKGCIFAGQVGLVGHVEIADNVTIVAQSGVSKGISKAGTYFGSPAKEFKTALKLEALIRNLPESADKLKTLEKRIKELEEKLSKQERGNS